MVDRLKLYSQWFHDNVHCLSILLLPGNQGHPPRSAPALEFRMILAAYGTVRYGASGKYH